MKRDQNKARKKIRTWKGRLLPSLGEVTSSPCPPVITPNEMQNPEAAAPGKEPSIEGIAQVLCSEQSCEQPWLGAARRVVWVGVGQCCLDLQANRLFYFSKTFSSFRTLVLPSPPQGHYEAPGARWEWKPLVYGMVLSHMCPTLSALGPVASFRDACGKITGPSFTHHNPVCISSLQTLQQEERGQVPAFASAEVRSLLTPISCDVITPDQGRG